MTPGDTMMYSLEWRAMGCEISIQLHSDATGAQMLGQIPDIIARLESQLTRFDPQSDLMRLNAQTGDWVTVSETLFENIRIAKHGARLTNGLYNPLVFDALLANGYDRNFADIAQTTPRPTSPAHDWRTIQLRAKTREVFLASGARIDLGGVAKGWTATYIADILAPFGACLVNIGGDMVARGAPAGAMGWYVDIEDPLTSNALIRVCLRDQSIVSSGVDYRYWHDADGVRYHHIIDPRTGSSAVTDVLSISVIHPDAFIAEVYAKALIIQGADRGLNWLNKQWDSAGLLFHPDGKISATTSFVYQIHPHQIYEKDHS